MMMSLMQRANSYFASISTVGTAFCALLTDPWVLFLYALKGRGGFWYWLVGVRKKTGREARFSFAAGRTLLL